MSGWTQKQIKTISDFHNRYSTYNQGNDCDACENQYLCGQYGDATGCHRKDKGLECEFIESGD